MVGEGFELSPGSSSSPTKGGESSREEQGGHRLAWCPGGGWERAVGTDGDKQREARLDPKQSTSPKPCSVSDLPSEMAGSHRWSIYHRPGALVCPAANILQGRMLTNIFINPGWDIVCQIVKFE